MSDSFFHPTALVESPQIGQGTNIWAFAHVMKDAVIGSNCNIGDHCFIESGVTIGNGVTIKNGNMLFEGLTLEDGVFVGPHVFFTNDLYPRSPRLEQAHLRYENKDWLSPTTVQRGVTLGAGAVIIAGVSIGEFAMIGAGAVVTKDVSPYALVVGNPARVHGWVCQCGQRITFSNDQAACSTCGKKYKSNQVSIDLIN
jgi:UDP-2-acetamido-3-amino-2,3-dideoxy-glucuronate N-acetyltransferase